MTEEEQQMSPVQPQEPQVVKGKRGRKPKYMHLTPTEYGRLYREREGDRYKQMHQKQALESSKRFVASLPNGEIEQLCGENGGVTFSCRTCLTSFKVITMTSYQLHIQSKHHMFAVHMRDRPTTSGD